MTYEHTPTEGPPIANLMDFVCNEFKSGNFDNEDATGSVEPTTPVHFTVSDSDKETILQSKTNIDTYV
ncbi:unnamed protein product [Gongylonema pulchrum]|uniref:Carn_acyltransf domain-containing protein n=1 Tax=Gongylonema pulchrum TaxID=637853 RepID=A0A183DGT2_9BILA|nr:unnamed protein product [Gongylonema pulchrum]